MTDKKESKYMGVNIDIKKKKSTFVTRNKGEEYTPEEYGKKMGLDIHKKDYDKQPIKQKRKQTSIDYTEEQLDAIYNRDEKSNKGNESDRGKEEEQKN